jgi:predicted  nucleic acid-binding Zn-ribbon protein
METVEQELARLRTTVERLRDEVLFADMALKRLKEDIKAVGLDIESIRRVAAAIRGTMT